MADIDKAALKWTAQAEQRNDMFKIAIAIAITIAALAAATILTGCATPIVTLERVDGIDYIQHIDDLDTWPDGCSKVGGCHQIVDGIPHIWITGISPEYIVAHERAHVAGMQHTGWTWNGQKSCTVITAGGGKYHRGQRICIDASGEHIK